MNLKSEVYSFSLNLYVANLVLDLDLYNLDLHKYTKGYFQPPVKMEYIITGQKMNWYYSQFNFAMFIYKTMFIQPNYKT